MTWRAAVRDGAETTLTAFQAANTSLCDRVYRARPESVADTKSVFISGIGEPRILHSAGIRQRDAEVEIVCSVHLADNEETTDKLDDLADAVIDWLTANPHAFGAITVQAPVRATPVELNEGGLIVPAVAITCSAQIQEGRL